MGRAGITFAAAGVVLWCSLAWAQSSTRSADAPVRVYGIEIEAREEGERVLVFADGDVERRVETPGPGHTRIVVLGTVLADSAPRDVTPGIEGAIRSVRARERVEDGRQVVEVEVTHAEGLRAQVSSRGAILAVEFPPYFRPDDRGFAIRLENEALDKIVDELARATGAPYVYDADTLRGTATIIANDEASPEEALALLDAALYMRGFAAVPGPEGHRKIVPIPEALTIAPWDPEAPGPDAEAPVTTMIRIERADLDEIVRLLAPAVGSSGLAIPVFSNRSVILAGNEAQLHRWVTLAQALDRAHSDEVRVIRLRERPAGEVAEMLEELLPAPAGGTTTDYTVTVDDRSNALIIQASPERLAEIRTWIDTLDETPVGRGNLRVIRLHHSDPEEIAGHLRSLAQGEASESGAELEGMTVGVHDATNSIVVRASPSGQEVVADVVRSLDLRPPQVNVEVTVMEIRVGEDLDLSLNYVITVGDPESGLDAPVGRIFRIPEGGFEQDTFDIANRPTVPADFAGRMRQDVSTTINGPEGPREVIFPLHQVLVTAENNDAQSRILMRPHFIATNGEEQEFFVGDVIPIPVQADSQTEGSLTLERDIERTDVGMELRVRPTIGQAGGVTLNLELDLSEVDLSAPSELGPVLLNRRLRANAHLRDGEFAVIGFSSQADDDFNEQRTPWLGDIPLFGWLFRSQSDSQRRRYFVVAAQATIIRDADEQLADSIRARVAWERSVARIGQVGRMGDTRYAVLVATRARPDAAEQVARSLPLADGEESQVNGWNLGGRNRFDILVTGYSSLVEAGRALPRLSGGGYRPRVIAIPRENEES